MSAGLVDGRDLVIGKLFQKSQMTVAISLWVGCLTFFFLLFPVAANLRKIVDEPQTNKNVTFKLVSVSESWSIVQGHYVIKVLNIHCSKI